ncbi:hypothetical protein AVEN_197325-1 [Araneus ventricosus]|uniref:HTH psq-type domain-containing protein n=1 Tax=Araneus ventricosus TaxID=182803 RepID=A0A4Y2EZY2_ARAVE|nr:hypothetical protein AVEN_197325-1 [Araneus ventricosus]
MSPKKNPQEGSHKRRQISVEVKRKMIGKREGGGSVTDLSRTCNRSTSGICTILKKKDFIQQIVASKGVTRILTQRLTMLKGCFSWGYTKNNCKTTLFHENSNYEKVKVIFTDLVKATILVPPVGLGVEFRTLTTEPNRGYQNRPLRRPSTA